MNSVNDIWDKILELLSAQLTNTAIETWFSDCSPVELDEFRLVLHTSTDFKRDIIQKRFSDKIKVILSDLFSCDFDVLVLSDDDYEEYLESKSDPDDSMPEMKGYTFDHFVVGNSNRFAHAAAQAVAEKPGQIYNPLFIYGNSGLGKTHLLYAIGTEIHQRDKNKLIKYVKGEEFTNQMIQSIRTGSTEDFRNRYRSVDLLLVDDIQFIAGKQSTQDEFFHTFNSIYEAGKQIVIASDRPPKDMATLDDRLRTRFEWGLMVDIQPPDLETRMAITRNKASQLGLMISDEAVEYISSKCTNNIRQLEGVIKKLTAYKEILGDVISIDSIKRALHDVIIDGISIPTPAIIITETARYYGLEEKDIRSQSRSKNTAIARQVAMYLIRTLTNLPLSDIGAEFENRTHATVLSSIRKIEDLMKKDSQMASTIRDITSNINTINTH